MPMELYISNPSTQTKVFFYSLPSDVPGRMKGPYSLMIQSGRQEVIGTGWPDDHVHSLIEQIERDGGRETTELKGAGLKRFNGLLYQIGKPVEPDLIREAHEADVKTREDRSVEMTINSALAADRVANADREPDGTVKFTPAGGQRKARGTKIEVIEQKMPGERRTGEEVEFALEVAPDGARELKRAAR